MKAIVATFVSFFSVRMGNHQVNCKVNYQIKRKVNHAANRDRLFFMFCNFFIIRLCIDKPPEHKFFLRSKDKSGLCRSRGDSLDA